MDFNGIRRLYLPLRPKARFSPERKTPPSVSAPSAGLRPLIVSRVKCGGGPCRGHSVLPCTGNTICLHCAFIKGARFGIFLRKHLVAATRFAPHLTRETISGRRPAGRGRYTRLSLSSRRKTILGAEGNIESADAVGIHRCLTRCFRV